MSIIAKITVPLLGQVHTLTVTDVSNWQDVMDHIGSNTCLFKIIYNDITYEGLVTKTVDDLNLFMVFDDTIITLPSGMCAIIDCLGNEPETEDTHTHCHDNLITPIVGDENLMVLDTDGCPIGYINVAQLLTYLEGALDIPTGLCDLLDVAEIPQGGLVAGDRVLTTVPGGCTLKSVPQEDLACEP